MSLHKKLLYGLALCLLSAALATPALAQGEAGKRKKIRSALRPATMMPRTAKRTQAKKDQEDQQGKEGDPDKEVAQDKAKKGDAPEKDDSAEAMARRKEAAKQKIADRKAAKKGSKAIRKKKNSAIVRVVGSYRPVDLRLGGVPDPKDKMPTPAAQRGLDFYLALEEGSTVRVGQEFSVYRRVAAPTVRRAVVTLKVGEMRVVGIEGNMGVARVIGAPIHAAHPYLKTPGVLVGDFIVSTRPLNAERYEKGYSRYGGLGGAEGEEQAKARALEEERLRMEAEARRKAEEEERLREERLKARRQAQLRLQKEQANQPDDADMWLHRTRAQTAWSAEENPDFEFEDQGTAKRDPLPEDKDSYPYWDEQSIEF
jgi:hypothetical protein